MFFYKSQKVNSTVSEILLCNCKFFLGVWGHVFQYLLHCQISNVALLETFWAWMETSIRLCDGVLSVHLLVSCYLNRSFKAINECTVLYIKHPTLNFSYHFTWILQYQYNFIYKEMSIRWKHVSYLNLSH